MKKNTKPKITATKLKGVYELNPTKMVMKAGSEQARRAVTQGKKPTTPKGKKK